METRIAVLADYANITADNKLNVSGTFTQIMSQGVPATHPTMTVVWQVEYGADEDAVYPLEIELVNADGGVLQKLSGPLEFPKPPAGKFGTKNLLFNFVMLAFEKFGLYEFRLRLGQDTTARIPFEVIRIP